MSDKPSNPSSREEALQERKKICQDFFPDLVQTGEFKSIPLRDEIKKPMYAIVRKSAQFNKQTVYPNETVAALSLEDYQSVCVQKNVKYTTQKLISLCAQGNVEEADKISPGFYEKYKSSIQETSTGYNVEGDIYQQMQEDVRKDFAKNNPDFLRNTEEKWREDRAAQMLTNSDIDSIPVSDNAYYFLATESSYYCCPNDEVNRATAELRQKNDAIVQQMRDNEGNSKQTTKQTMLSDAERAHDAGDNAAQKAKESTTNTIDQTQHTDQQASNQTTNNKQPRVAAVTSRNQGR